MGMTWSNTRHRSAEECANSSLVTYSACCVAGERSTSTPSKMSLFMAIPLLDLLSRTYYRERPLRCSSGITFMRRLLSGFAYRSQERLHPFLFPNQCHRSNCMRLCLQSCIIMETEEHNYTVRSRCAQCGSGCDRVSRGHGNIQEHDIGMKRLLQVAYEIVLLAETSIRSSGPHHIAQAGEPGLPL